MRSKGRLYNLNDVNRIKQEFIDRLRKYEQILLGCLDQSYHDIYQDIMKSRNQVINASKKEKDISTLLTDFELIVKAYGESYANNHAYCNLVRYFPELFNRFDLVELVPLNDLELFKYRPSSKVQKKNKTQKDKRKD